jgi:protein phosphatase
MTITVPEFSLVVLIGSTGSGKSTFARKHFKPTEIVSSDACRAMVSDDENDQAATAEAFELLHAILDIRLKRRKLCVADATNLRPEDRKHLLDVARRWHALAVAIVLDPGEEVCRARNRRRADRDFGPHVIRNHHQNLRRGLRGVRKEGFANVYRLSSEAEIERSKVERQPLWTDRRHERGPFDIIGDVHGCFDELTALMAQLGYVVERDEQEDGPRFRVSHPEGRKIVFVGDIVDRGPRVADALRLVMDMVEDGAALCVLGNHEVKVSRWLGGRDVKPAHGLDRTIAELNAQSEVFRQRVKRFLNKLVSHYVLDEGRLAAAHAGITEIMLGRASGRIREFCVYGDTTGETDEFGLPVRHDWAAEYRGRTKVVYGHTPTPEAEWVNNTLCVDTGCVFGGKLTALRYPEMELADVPAREVYAEPARPLAPPPAVSASAQQESDAMLDLADVTGKRTISTSLMPAVSIRAENAAAALEAMSRFAIDPRLLIHLPPTMSPPETSQLEGFLEHPAEAFAYFRREGVEEVICEVKHMGSRALILACRDAEAARKRFGLDTGETGAVYTRSGRPFFADGARRDAVLARTARALERSGLFEELESDWALLDAEIMPWSAKAQSLIEGQYGAAGSAARIGLGAVKDALARAAGRGVELGGLLEAMTARERRAEAFSAAVRRYAWPVESLDDYRIAPFHLLASEGRTHKDKSHRWHMDILGRFVAGESGVKPLFEPTSFRAVNLASEEDERAATEWWLEITAQGSEGIVVKPAQYVARGRRGLAQPAVKCRGREYLRIIYGPDYDAPENLTRLRKRGLGAKRSLALREFSLGLEALERFVAREPLRRVHECVFGVLALESEPVDPRL